MMTTWQMCLKIVSILIIILCCLAVALGVLVIVGAGLVGTALGGNLGLFVAGTLGVIGGGLILLSNGFQLACGIVGLKAVSNPNLLNTAYILSIIHLFFAVVGLISDMIGGNALAGLLSLVLPVLYFISVYQLRRGLL